MNDKPRPSIGSIFDINISSVCIDDALDVLRKREMLYDKDGATWFRATDFGDEKDRVVVRANGVKTYFASDIAYHFDKRERGFDHLIDILGADHHGYISRVGGGLAAMGYSADDLEVELVQFVALYRGGEKVQMSTRSGKFDTLRKLRAEVGNDAARFFYVSRSNDQHLDFDLDVARSESNDNPVYYVQYVHARICSIHRKAMEKGLRPFAPAASDLSGLETPEDIQLVRTMARFPEVLAAAATMREPHRVTFYLMDLASAFHAYYNKHRILSDDLQKSQARLYLVTAVQKVIRNGLNLLGVSAPQKM